MAQTIAYTSGASDPVASQVDLFKPASAMPVTIQLFGGAVDPTDGAAVFTWKWYLLDKPVGSATAFLDPDTTQNPHIGPIDVWGNYLFLLVATSGSAGGASEGNVLKAPATALVQVKVQQGTYLLEKPAKWARRWSAAYRALVDAFKQHHIEDHNGVSVATGTKVDILCSGGLAESAPGVPLHTHPGMGAPGVAVDTARASAWGSITGLGYTHLIVPQDLMPGSSINRPHAVVCIDEGLQITGYSISLIDGGDTGNYGFVLMMAPSADWTDGTPLLVTDSGLSAPSDTHKVVTYRHVLAAPIPVAAHAWVGIVCVACPANPGVGLTVNIETSAV